MFVKPFCLCAEQYCRSYMCDGIVGCEDCSEYKGYGYRKYREGVK